MSCDIPHEEGVYVFDRGSRRWTRIEVDGPWVPREDGTYLVYFRNKICPGCKGFDKLWRELVYERIDELQAVPAMVQCTNFFFNCSDRTAADTFILFLVNATPQVLVLVVEGGELRFMEREFVFDSVDDLIEFANGVRDRMAKYAAQGEEESAAGGEELFIEGEDWKEIVEKIKKLLFEGKNIREICDERGCRYVVE